jgi:HNH endonuclease
MIDIQTLQEILSYDPKTGDLFWKIKMSDKATPGKKAGTRTTTMCVDITIFGHRLKAHRVAWAIHTGMWPIKNIDHINGNPRDNRIENLRDVSQRENTQNLYRAKSHNKVGLLGVVRDKKNFAAKIVVNGSRIHLGNFSCASAAHDAYLTAKKKYHIEQSTAILAGEPVAGARIVKRDRLTIK